MQYRAFTDADYAAMEALDLACQRHADAGFDQLAERERLGRLHTSLPALKFYERSEHSFVAAPEDVGGPLAGFILAQSVWQGDRPVVLVRTLSVSPQAEVTAQATELAAGLLHACIKSAYDSAVYEVHFALTPTTAAAAQAEEAHLIGRYGVIHLGTRAQSAPGEKLTKIVRAPGA